MVSIVLLAGGKGSRINSKVPKQFLFLAGKPIIMHILERIDSLEAVDEIIVVCNEKYIEETNQMINDYLLIPKEVFYARTKYC